MDRLIIDENTNTLMKCKHHMYGERLDYLVIPHSYNGKQIDTIGPHCFNHLIIGQLCIEEGVKYLADSAFENACILNVKLPRGIFDGCISLSSLKLEGSFDKLGSETFAGASELYSLELQTSADSLYIPPDCFCDTNLKEISLLGQFEPIVEKRSCFPDDILIRGYDHSTPLTTLGYYFDFEAI